jgi:hypothetical protein
MLPRKARDTLLLLILIGMVGWLVDPGHHGCTYAHAIP